MDLIAYVPRMPAVGETITGSAFQTGFGGKGANQCVIAAKLGAVTAMCGAVGDDSFGRDMVANFKRVGTDVSLLKVIPGGTTGVAPIWVDAAGANSIVVVPGANDLVTADDAAAAVTALAAGGALRALLCQLEVPVPATVAALEAARRCGGVTTFFSPAPAPTDPAALPASLWAACDVAVPNAIEAGQVAGPEAQGMRAAIEARLASSSSGRAVGEDGCSLAPIIASATALLQRGCGAVVVTLGAAGALVVLGPPSVTPADVRATLVPSVRLAREEVVDTTGAGDAFAGSMATFYAALAQRSPSGSGAAGRVDVAALVEAVRRAAYVASQTVKKKGTQSSYLVRSELPEALFAPGQLPSLPNDVVAVGGAELALPAPLELLV